MAPRGHEAGRRIDALEVTCLCSAIFDNVQQTQGNICFLNMWSLRQNPIWVRLGTTKGKLWDPWFHMLADGSQ